MGLGIGFCIGFIVPAVCPCERLIRRIAGPEILSPLILFPLRKIVANPSASTHFYKYRACDPLERLEQILVKHELYFPTAAQLNDPAECQRRVVFASQRSKVRFLMRTRKRLHPRASVLDVATEFGRAWEGINQIGEERFHEEFVQGFYEVSTQTRIFSMPKRWDPRWTV